MRIPRVFCKQICMSTSMFRTHFHRMNAFSSSRDHSPNDLYLLRQGPGRMLHERDSCRLSYPLHSANDIFTRIACNFSKFAVVPTCIVSLTIFLSFLSIRQFMVLRLQPWKLRSDCFNVDSFCSSTNLGIPTMSD